jgi:hypothetical protein
MMMPDSKTDTHANAPGLASRSRRRLTAAADAAWLGFSSLLPGPANHHEIRIVALRRSGHHAVINWLLHQIKGRHAFLNDCRAGTNPFLSCRRSSSRPGTLFPEHSQLWWRHEAAGWHSKRGFLLYNYEDQTPAQVASQEAEAFRERWVGRSARRCDMLILRDPYNLLASKLRWAYGERFQPSLDSLFVTREAWKAHAREYLGETAHLPDRVAVSYNAWFTDPAYRRRLAGTLGLEWSDKGMQEVARWGPTLWGDSFDGLKYDGRATEMKVLERWRAYEDDRFFLNLVDDEELRELSERIFGPLPGIERVLGGSTTRRQA